MDLRLLETEVIDLCREAGKALAEASGKIAAGQMELKAFNHIVTDSDKATETFLVNGLSDLLPGSGFLTEEETKDVLDREYTWIIDPIDGTTNFYYGLPVFSISIALQQNGETILGVVFDPNRGEAFSALKGSGARLNGRPIQCRKTNNLQEALLATGFPYFDFEYLDEYIDCLKYLLSHSRGMRRMGSAAIDLAYVAAGRFDAFFEYALSPWDVAAGALLVEEAGGVVTDFAGGNDYLRGKQIVAGGKLVQEELLKVIRDFLPSGK